MRITLVDPAPPSRILEPYEHLGLAYLSSSIQKKGHEVKIISSVLDHLSISKTINRILLSKPQIIGFSLKETFASRAFKIIEGLRQRGCKAHITQGGHYPTFNQQEILRDFKSVNSIVRGEGEDTFLELVESIESGSDFQAIKGLSYRQNGRYVVNPARPKIPDLDSLPFPAREQTSKILQRGGFIDLVCSRGCYANCSFCSIQSFYRLSAGPNYRQRSVANIVDEIESLIEKFGNRDFKFVDDQFIGPGHKGQRLAREFADELKRRHLKISFQFSCRVSEIDKELLTYLRSVGLKRVLIGLESAHQRGLDTFNKGTTIEQNQKALAILDELGISYIIAFILTDAFTTWDELKQNISFLAQVKSRVDRVGGLLAVEPSLQPHKGTPIFNSLMKLSRLQGNYKMGFRYHIPDYRVRLFLSIWKILEYGLLPIIYYLKKRFKTSKK